MSEADDTQPLGQAQARNGLVLDDAGVVVEVTKGYFDVFAVGSEAIGAAGSLHHLLRAGPNQPVAGGIPLPPGIDRLLAVPGPGAKFQTTAIDDWIAYVEDGALEETQELIHDSLRNWFEQLAVERPAGAPRRLVAGEAATAEAGDWLACDHGIVVVELEEGRLSLLGSELSTLRSGESVIATHHVWLAAAEAGTLKVTDQEDVDDPALLLGAFVRTVRQLLLVRCEAVLARENASGAAMRGRQGGVQSMTAEGVLVMQRLLDEKASAPSAPASSEASVFAAAKLVCDSLGIELRDIGGGPTEPKARAVALANASGFRVREVTLAGEWWLADNGPLLAFRADDETPLALMAGRRRQYEAVDTVSGARTRVDADLAAELKPFGLAFYRPFPRQPVGIADLVTYGFHGRGHDFALSMGIATLIAFLAMVLPIATAEVVDEIIPSAKLNVLMRIGIVLIVAALVQVLFELAKGQVLVRLTSHVEHDIQAAVWDRLLGMPIDFFREYAVGDLTMRVNAVNTIAKMLSVSTLTGLVSGIFGMLGFVVLLKFSPVLALVAFVLVLLGLALLAFFTWWTFHSLHSVEVSMRRVMAVVLQLVQGVSKLRTTASESRAMGVWSDAFSSMRRIRLLILKLKAQQEVILRGYHRLGLLVVLGMMATLSTKQGGAQLSSGELIGFFSAFSAIFMSLVQVCETIIGLFLVVPMYKMAKPILEHSPEGSSGEIDPGEIAGAIEISQVSFSYPDGEPVLDDVSISIPAGSFTAIVGPSGSGKSTLLRLLLGFEEPSGGAILFDDHALIELDQQALRRQFGVVLQNSPMLAGDIHSNIVGVKGGTLDDAWAAARMVGLEQDIKEMAMGMHTAIGEGSSTLSGGQRQRILIARALAGNPKILFLDEATSALDNKSQTIVAESLLRLKATRVVIAHRLSTIVEADQIIVLEAGKVVQQGRYDELLEQEGAFAELAKRQNVDISARRSRKRGKRTS
ncbi:MAG: NHLP bacteriocin export ABC transporter permease/ATPase subunit [Rhodocyclales bacterium]|nr:NHLP bacteriocin export ABC transporter permease/ATPase subunit [Rhodocyclales bacterium]